MIHDKKGVGTVFPSTHNRKQRRITNHVCMWTNCYVTEYCEDNRMYLYTTEYREIRNKT
jgi:hypothetical protein